MKEIVLENVSKEIKKIKVLDNIGIRLEAGKVYGLRGHNGSGKTMLLRLISGLIVPTTGTVAIDGEILGKTLDYPKSMGILIENPAFLDEFTGYENLKMIASLNNHIEEKDIENILDTVGLGEGGYLKYHKYSLGMKQRLGIAAAIMENPELILLDEPTNALDDMGIEKVIEIINNLKAENRIIIIASHEKEFLNRISDEIFLMENGRIRREGE